MPATPSEVHLTDRPRQREHASIRVDEIRTRRDRNEFLHLPWKIYADDPNWVPPLLVEVKQFIDAKHHPFYRHGAAAKFIARSGGEVVGRILVSDDPRYNAEHDTNLGCFGMFESVDSVDVAQALFDAAASWLRLRGRTQMIGPIDYSTNYPCGLLIEGFDTPPRVMMNHQPRYYMDLHEACGFSKAKDLYAWWFVDPYDMVEKWRRRADRLAKRGGVTVRPFRIEDIQAEVQRCKAVYNEAWTHNWGFVKMTDAEFDHFASSMRRVADPELLLLAEVEKKPVGFSMTLPDINEAIRPLNGKLTWCGLPVGIWQLYRNFKRIKTARMLTFGVLERYRRRGVSELLILRTLDYGKNTLHYTAAELSWTLEDNDLINRTIEAVGARKYKTYRIYEKDIA